MTLGWDDIKPLLEFVAIVIGIIGTGSVVIWWNRITNNKKIIDLAQERDQYKIDYDNLKEAYDQLMVIIEASEQVIKDHPDAANTFLEILSQKNKIKAELDKK